IVFNLLGFFTLQVSGGLNVFNFFAVSTVPLTIFAAFTLEEWVVYKKRLGMVLVVVFVLLTIPRSLYEDGISFYRYMTHVDSYVVSQDELSGLMFLRMHAQKGSLVQSHPMNHWDMRAPYVAFFTDHDAYLSGIGIQETHNQPIKAREARLQYIFTAPNSDDFRAKLIQNGITYVYWRKNNEEVFPYKPTEGHFYYLFENNGVTILSPKH
ncbi:MAG: hypothetical protein KGJ07_04815, partial [Patescibacteria group bacterium]|nr:hypothetical protein [Patescibacteria group bacterium]